MAQLARFSPAAVVQRITRGGEAAGAPDHTIDEIIAEAASHRPNIDAALIRRAYDTAVTAHEGQLRSSGEEYITHPVAVTHYLATLQMDAETLAAALLHDVVEDTDFTIEEIEKRFGRDVARLVDGVTKLSKFGSARTMEEQQAENLRKMFMAMAEDMRVVIIKLADRLHNMQHAPAPAAGEAATHRSRDDGDLRAAGASPRHLADQVGARGPRLPATSSRRSTASWSRRWRTGDERASASSAGPSASCARSSRRSRINAEISGRPKHLYSIAKKMERKGAELHRDLRPHRHPRARGRREATATTLSASCTRLWRPVPGQFDDYIAIPKANMYQSLHTTVIGPEAQPLEVQIRTRRDARDRGVRRRGALALQGRVARRPQVRRALSWLRQLMDWQHEVSDAHEFVEGLKTRRLPGPGLRLHPQGRGQGPAAGATPIDFAYRIHTDVGHRTIGAKVNNRLVPLDYHLQNGDIVEIVTTKAAHGPSRDWLNIVKTSHAREKIRAWFKRQQRDENITQGKELLDRELRRLAHETLASVDAAKLTEIASQYKLRELDDFYAAIGYGAISSASVVSKLEIHDDVEIMLPEEAPPAAPSTTGVKVKGVGDLLVRFAKCCSPIPGDQITGYVTRGKGVTIHRSSCPSVLSERDIERLIDVEWELVGQQTYPITVRITAIDRPGLLNDVTNVVAEYKVNIVAASVATHDDGTATITATFKVTSLQQLAHVLTKIERLRDVTSVTREAR